MRGTFTDSHTQRVEALKCGHVDHSAWRPEVEQTDGSGR